MISFSYDLLGAPLVLTSDPFLYQFTQPLLIGISGLLAPEFPLGFYEFESL